ncbi:tetratricopeptide repeat protein [Gemmata sp. JC717]|uniref:protein kinase domain-containing protein n=1 Tax=Gemmata algarum TaxID=2975278 RepID=UPI0021BADCF5|nr:serine/threonine-protein kinase [Gemmata algarum]MDY3555759.1 tetratricopeptide repeat protein [Gemmata algarum]
MVDCGAELDRIVTAFESAWASGPPALESFLPHPGSEQFLPVLAELVRVDLEFRRRRGERARLDRYRDAFPQLFADRTLVLELAFEEYRLRVGAGEPAHPREYAARYGVDTAGWPAPESHPSAPPTHVLTEPAGAEPRFPAPGEVVGDFRLLSELGRGSFGRVYLAEQIGLAERRVAVKLSTRFGAAEPETLARLQHTHIVPVYSAHRVGTFQLVVMPFLGALTVADLLADQRTRGEPIRTGQALADTLNSRREKTAPPSGPLPGASADAPPLPVPAVALETLKRFTYPEAVLWIGAKLADALAHAHDRGVLHRDVKPANVLLTDDGQPMLLDFNLAADSARPGTRAGGTPAYMAPEQLALLQGRHFGVDGRADVFALGAVLYEMLTDRHPFPPPAGSGPDVAFELLRLRAVAPPNPGELNPAVSPSAAAIVLKCLAPDPVNRYPSAHALRADLERQLAHQPLAHTREPSIRERLHKWRRRHPRLASSGSVAAVSVVLLALLGGAAVARQERVKQLETASAAARARQEAEAAYHDFKAEARDALPQLVVYGHDPGRLAKGEERVRALLNRFAVLESADWPNRPEVQRLAEADRFALRMQVAEMLMVLARVGADRATGFPPGPERDAGLNAALDLISRAEVAYDPEAVPRAVLFDRAEVLARLGRTDESLLRADRLPNAAPSARDAYLAGTARLGRGEYRVASRLLEDATARDPRQFWAWFNLGVAHLGLGRDADAEGCFNACLALEPDYAMAHFNRALARFNRKQFPGAEADFSAALKLNPDLTDALANRALTRLELGRLAEAEADLTKALDLGASETRLYFLRADVRDRRGDKPGAAADRAAGLTKPPTDEPSFVARGLARATSEPAAALADFDAALKLNPRSFPALQNRAFVLADKLDRPADALAALDRALELYPDALPARAGRAVLRARKGDRAAAHKDAEHCLGQRPGADIVYQVAGAYALTSKVKAEDAKVALRLLSDALTKGYGFDLLAIDPDLKPLHETKEFQKLLDAAKAVRPVVTN